jgi:hypothetical protein
VERCGRRVHGLGLCHAHWRRWKKTGIRGGEIRDVSLTLVERFWAKVDKNGPTPEACPDLGPCWLWTAGKTKEGYGHFNGGPGRTNEAHRFAYEEDVGAIPNGLVLDHLCRTPPCVNPLHLDPTTVLENLARGLPSPSRINRDRTRCHRGHPFDQTNTVIESNGHRRCRTCRSAYNQTYRSAE